MGRPIYRIILALGIVGLVLAAAPSSAAAHPSHTPLAARGQAGPTFTFPSTGQSFPLSGSMLFQLRPLGGAKGYLWSFVQGGAVVYQDLAWTGHLDGTTYTVAKDSTAERLLRSGPMQVWVRAWMGGARWSATGGLRVRLTGSHGGSSGPGTKPPSGPPSAGKVLYQANWSNGLNGWTASPDWKTVGGELVNDGSNGDATHIAHPPTIRPYTPNYAVEADIQAVRTGSNPCVPGAFYVVPAFGFFVRGESSGDYRVGINGVQGPGTLTGDVTAFIFDHKSSDACPGYQGEGYPGALTQTGYTLDTGWHTYRVEVRGNDIKLLIDKQVIVETTDNHHLTGNSVGLWSNAAVINVRSFKVVAL